MQALLDIARAVSTLLNKSQIKRGLWHTAREDGMLSWGFGDGETTVSDDLSVYHSTRDEGGVSELYRASRRPRLGFSAFHRELLYGLDGRREPSRVSGQ